MTDNDQPPRAGTGTKPLPVVTPAELAKVTKERDALAARIKEIEKADAKMVEENGRLAKANADAGMRIADLEKTISEQRQAHEKIVTDYNELAHKYEALRASAAKDGTGKPKVGAFRPWLHNAPPSGEPQE